MATKIPQWTQAARASERRWRRSVLYIALTTALLGSPATSLAQTELPPLPRLVLDSYPPSAREAISRAHDAATARPSDAAAVGALARTLHAWEQWESAHQAYVRCQAIAPRNLDCQYLDALVLQRLARQDEAAARFKEALLASPDYLPARVGLADATFEAGHLEKGKALFESLTANTRTEPAAQFGLGRIDAAAGRHEAAIKRFQRAIDLFPEFAAAHYALALSYRATGQTDAAQRELKLHSEYGNRWPGIEDPVRDSVSSLRDDPAAILRRGVALADADDVNGAIAAHEAALARDPKLVQAHANLVSLYGRAGNFAKGEEHYRAALALDPNLGEVQYDYGVLLGMQQKWDEAAEAYRRAIAVNPAHARAHNNLGQILERQRQFDAAAASYQRAVESQPTFRLARFNLARMLLALGQTDAAIAELTGLVQDRNPDTPRYLFALSAAHLRAGHKEEALKYGTEARNLALEFGQNELAAIIERDLAKVK